MSNLKIPLRLRKMLFAIFLGRGLMALRQFILVPILISAWGVDYYGSWLMLSALPTFLSMSNLGLGTSANIQIGLDISAGKHENAKSIFATSQWMIIFIGFIVTSISYIGMHWYGLKATTLETIQSSDIVMVFLLATLFINMLAIPLLGCWTGIGKPATGHNFLNCSSLISLLLSIAVPILGGHALETAVILLISSFSTLLIFIFFTFKSVGWNRSHYSLVLIDLKLGKYLFVKGLGHQLGQLWQAILFQGSLLLAGSLLGPAGAALWGSMRILIRSGNQVIEIISQSMSPEFQIAFAQNDRENLIKLYIMSIVFSLSLSILVLIGLVTVGPIIFNSWTRHTFVVSTLAWGLLSLSLIPFSLWNLSGELQRAINQPWILNIYAVIASIISIISMAIFSGMGILAFSLGAFIFDFCMMLFVMPRTLNLLSISFVGLLLEARKILRNFFKNGKISYKSLI